MNKILKYSLIFGGTVLGAAVIYKVATKKKDSGVPTGDADGSYTKGTGEDAVIYTPKNTASLNRNLVLKAGVFNSPEVKALQRILGLSSNNVDGDFGTQVTEPALFAKTGLKQTTLNTIEKQIADYAAKNAATAKILLVQKQFPKGKGVVAAVTFRGYAHELRNGAWYSTNSDGDSLPSKEFKVTANVGTIAYYDSADPTKLIIRLDKSIDGYPFVGVKSSWVK